MFSKIHGDFRKSRCITGINDTGNKFAAGINDTGGICHLYRRCQQHVSKQNIKKCCELRFFPFATSVSDTGGAPPRIFENMRNGPIGILRAWGKLIHEKNQKSKFSWHCPFKGTVEANASYQEDTKII
jgi:hypothetical protein